MRAAWQLKVACKVAVDRGALYLHTASVPIAVLMQEVLQACKCRLSRMAAGTQIRATKYDIAHVDRHFFAYDMQHFCKTYIATWQETLQSRIASSRRQHVVDVSSVISCQRFSSCCRQPFWSISLAVR